MREPKNEASARLHERLKIGEELLKDMELAGSAAPNSAVNVFREKAERWNDYNHTLLMTLFADGGPALEYSQWLLTGANRRNQLNPLANLYRAVTLKVRRLRSLLDRMELFHEAPSAPPAARSLAAGDASTVFIVHGRDEGAKHELARFLEKLKLNAIILHEQADRGRVLLEKLEDEGSRAGFAVILLTPDDVGSLSGGTAQPRGRQNVVFELGYFAGRLGRANVKVLLKGAVEKPSDLEGLIYIEMDTAGAWRQKLAIELRAAGMKIDAEALVT